MKILRPLFQAAHHLKAFLSLASRKLLGEPSALPASPSRRAQSGNEVVPASSSGRKPGQTVKRPLPRDTRPILGLLQVASSMVGARGRYIGVHVRRTVTMTLALEVVESCVSGYRP